VFYLKWVFRVAKGNGILLNVVSATIAGVFNLELMRNDFPYVSFCENALAEIDIDISLI
jgi:hypothetical protein